MSNKDKVLATKFETIKSKIDAIAKEYSIARSKNDSVAMDELEKEYEEAKTLLWSNEAHFRYLKSSKVKMSIKKAQDLKRKENLIEALRQKEAYKNKENRAYLDIVEKSITIDDYIKNKSNRPIKNSERKKVVVAFALGASLIAAFFGIGSKMKNKGKQDDKTNPIETTLQSEEEQNIKEETTSLSDDIRDEETSVNVIGKVDSTEVTKSTENNQEKEIAKLIPGTEKTVKEEALDPGVSNVQTSSTVTKSEVIIGASIAEQEPTDYVPSGDSTPEDDNKNDNKENSSSTDDKTNDNNDNSTPEDDKTNGNKDNSQSAAESAGNNIEEDPAIDYPIGKDDTIDPKFPPAGELPKEEKTTFIEKEEIPPESPADAAGNKIDDTKQDKPSGDSSSTDKKPEEDKTNDNKDNSQSAADAAGDVIDETDYGDADVKYYSDDYGNEPIASIYENDAVLNIDGEAYSLKLKC